MRHNTISNWLNLFALVLMFIMGIMNIVFPHKMLKMNAMPLFAKRLNGRQDRKTVWTVRVIGMITVLICIAGGAYFIWRYYC